MNRTNVQAKREARARTCHAAAHWGVVLWLLVGSATAHADEPQSGPQVLTLDDALRIAAEKNRDVLKALELRNLVEGRYVAERAAALPQLTIVSGISRDRDESQKAFGGDLPGAGSIFPLERDFRNAELGLSQVLFAWGQVNAAIHAASEGLALADDELNASRQGVAREVSAAFYDILLAKEIQAIAKQNLELKEHHLDEARRKLSAGTATDYDVLAGEVAAENARPEVIRAENLVRVARERLRFLLGIGEREVDVKGGLQTMIEPYTEYAQAVGVAWSKRPELSELAHRVEVARALVSVANAGDKPRLDFKAGYGWRQLVLGDAEANGQAWSIGVNLTLPVFDGLRARGQVAQARSDLASLQIEEAKLKDSISLQVRDAVNAVREAGEIVKALGGTVSQADRLLQMAEKGYEYGVKTRLDIEDAQLNLVQARGGLARAQRDYLVSRVTLQWVMGTLVEPAASDS